MMAIFIHSGASAGQSITELNNFYKYSPLQMSAGQPTEDQIAGFKDAGVEVVINLISSDFPGSIQNEEQLVVDKGAEYFYIPISWKNPSADDVRDFFKVMDKVKGKRVLVHCAFNARASAFVYLYRILRQGHDKKTEMEKMKSIWKKNKGYSLSEVPHWSTFLDKVIAAENSHG